jgi:2-C-methyl-D-erythritol 2,4-cyclodiphosphate synthase
MKGPRIGFGYDVHRFGGPGPVVLAGVEVDHPVGVLGTSDADVATHAVCDALLGAAAQGDLGMLFPSDDEQWHNANSMDLLAVCLQRVRSAGFDPGNIDVTIVAQDVLIAPHREAMRSNLAVALQIPMPSVSVKATTTDGLGSLGSGEGIAAHAVALVYP